MDPTQIQLQQRKTYKDDEYSVHFYYKIVISVKCVWLVCTRCISQKERLIQDDEDLVHFYHYYSNIRFPMEQGALASEGAYG